MTEEPLVLLLYKEMKRSHRWISIYFTYNKNFPRALRLLSLSSVVVCTLFFNSLLYNLVNPNDGSCQTYDSKDACLTEASPYSSDDTKCYWQATSGSDSEGRCRFKEPASSAKAVVFVAVVSAILSIPLVIVFEYIIMQVLSRPTASSLNSTVPQESLTGSQRTQGGERAANDNLAVANMELREMITRLLSLYKTSSKQEANELESLWGLTASQMEAYLTSGSSSYNINGRASQHSKHSVHPSSLPESAVDSDLVRVEPSDRRSAIRKTINALGGRNEMDVMKNVLKDLIAIQADIERESQYLALKSPEQQGIRLLVLFQKDLLVGVTGEIVEKKSMQGQQLEGKPVSKEAKVCGYIVIAALDLFLLFYIFLFAINQDQSRQMAWVQSFLIWLVLEIFFVSSVVMIMSEFVVPSLIYQEVKKIKTRMIKTVYDYQSKLLDNESDSPNTDSSEPSFDAAPYLFLSIRLAEKFPDSLESKVIREFHTTLPKRSYQHNKSSTMSGYRSRLRLTAVINSMNLMFMFLIGHLASLSVHSVERCFYDLISWAGLGYLTYWQAVLFQDKIGLALVVYLSLFIVLGTFVYYSYKSACRVRTDKRAGVISIKKVIETKEEKERIQEEASPAQIIMHDIVRTFMKQKPSKYNPRFERIMESLKKARACSDGTYADNNPERLMKCPSFTSNQEGEVAINFDISSSSDSEIDDTATASSPSHTVDLTSYVDIMREKPTVASKIRSRKGDLKRILDKRRRAKQKKTLLKQELELDVDISDCSDDSYVMSEDGGDVSLSSSDGSDNSSASSTENEKTVRIISPKVKDKHVSLNPQVQSGCSADVNGKSKDNSHNDTIKYDLSSSSSSDHNDTGSDAPRSNSKKLDVAKYVDILREKPSIASKIRGRKGDLKEILHKRRKAREMKSQLKQELELDIDISDCSDDSYVVDENGGSLSFSFSDSESKSNSDSGDELEEERAPSPTSLSRQDELTKRIVSSLFTTPKSGKSLRRSVKKHKSKIANMAMQQRKKGIEDSFVLNSSARRASLLANESRARNKLQKRIKQRHNNGSATIKEDEVDNGEERARNDIDGVKSSPAESEDSPFKRLTSFEAFNQRKSMVKNYAAHQTLREKSLESERKQARASLTKRIEGRKKSIPKEDTND